MSEKLKLIVLSGLPGSGKSTAARNLAKRYNAVVVARDDIQCYFPDMLEENKTILHVEYASSFLDNKTSIVADACNLEVRDAERWRELALLHHARFTWVHLPTRAAECIRRDAGRPNPIGPKSIAAMAERYASRLELLNSARRGV